MCVKESVSLLVREDLWKGDRTGFSLTFISQHPSSDRAVEHVLGGTHEAILHALHGRNEGRGGGRSR